VSEPLYGFLAASDALDLGSPLVVAEHIQPRCEPEIVFIMGADLSGPAVTSSAVLAATAAVAVGIEVLDSRTPTTSSRCRTWWRTTRRRGGTWWVRPSRRRAWTCG
jgi:2-keto-4-pentenoate hydratase